MAYLTSDAAQSVLPTTNWMYPAVTPAAGLPAGFETLIAPAKSLLLPAAEAEAAARAYLRALEELAGCPLAIVSTGPGRESTIVLQDPFA